MLFKNKFLLFFVISIGSVIGMVRGEEAKQKWVFKIKSKVDNKKLIAEKRQQAKRAAFYWMISKWLPFTTIEFYNFIISGPAPLKEAGFFLVRLY